MNTKIPKISVEDRMTLSKIVAAIDEHKGEDTVVLDVREFLVPTSFMIITTANNPKQLNAIMEAVETCLDVPPLQREGKDSQQWMVVDYGSVIIHMMSEEARTFYELDELWDGMTISLN